MKLGRMVPLGPRSLTKKKEFSSANVWNTLYQIGQHRPFDKLETNGRLWITLCMEWAVLPNLVEGVPDVCPVHKLSSVHGEQINLFSFQSVFDRNVGKTNVNFQVLSTTS